MRARPTPAASLRSDSPGSREASATPAIAAAIPSSWSADGRSPVAMPIATGIAAEAPATGATIIAPTCIPR